MVAIPGITFRAKRRNQTKRRSFNVDGVVKTSIYCVVELFPALGILPVCLRT